GGRALPREARELARSSRPRRRSLAGRRARADPVDRRPSRVRNRYPARRSVRHRRGAAPARDAPAARQEPRPLNSPRPSDLDPDVSRVDDAGSPWFEVGGDSVRLLRDGVQAFPVMLDAITRATREILLEMYWIGVDAVGAAFREALPVRAARAERARAGVKVLVIHGSVGSLGINEVWCATLSAAGSRVAEYASI